MQLSALRPTYVKPRASMKTRLTGFKVGSARQLRRGSKLEPTLVHPQPRAVLGDVAKGGPGRCCQFRRAPEDCRAPVTRVGRLFRRAPKAPASTVRVIPTPATPILRHYVAVVPIPGRLRTAPLHDEPGRRTMAGSVTVIDLRALSPLKWQHVNPYGTFTLDMRQCLPLKQSDADQRSEERRVGKECR